MYVEQPKILWCMSHHPVFSDICHTAQNSPMYVTQPRILQGMSHHPVFSNVCHTAQNSLWDHPQVAVELTTGGSEAAHRWQWGRPWLLVSRVTENTVNLESHLPRGRNGTISIIDSDSKIWWWSDEVYSWLPPPLYPMENVWEGFWSFRFPIFSCGHATL